MNRLEQTFAHLAKEGRKAFVGYLTAGDPDADTSFAILRAACGAGLDVLELGIPFSDPTSDGPVIQAAAARALASGMTLTRALELAKRLRAEVATPIVIFSYYNPLLKFGLERLGPALTEAGVDGLLVVDVPPEEAGELTAALEGRDLPLIRLIAPTTPTARQRTIVAGAAGFLYLITRTGVTGTGGLDVDLVARHALALKALTRVPVCLGFGVRSAADALALAPLADGVVVGSALVSLVADGGKDPETPARVAKLIGELRVALDGAAR